MSRNLAGLQNSHLTDHLQVSVLIMQWLLIDTLQSLGLHLNLKFHFLLYRKYHLIMSTVSYIPFFSTMVQGGNIKLFRILLQKQLITDVFRDSQSQT
jgi:hypothetical protein